METSSLREERVSEKRVFHGALIDVEHWQVRLPDGRESLREVVRHVGAAAVVPVDAQGRVALVRQHRVALDVLTLEVPAGKLDSPSEDPFLCAQRELAEETGLLAEDWHFLTCIYTTPGFCTERIALYLAQGLSQGDTHLDDDEFLRVEWMSLDLAQEKVMAGEIRDGKTIIGLLMAGHTLGVSPVIQSTKNRR